MQFEYSVSLSGETIHTISTDEPLPHIQVGHHLRLDLRECSTKPGFCLQIERVEVLFKKHPKFNANPPKFVIGLHCLEVLEP